MPVRYIQIGHEVKKVTQALHAKGCIIFALPLLPLMSKYLLKELQVQELRLNGVELHCANSYLVNQLISEHSNTRDDQCWC